MTKKQKQPTWTIEFVGIDVKLEGVMVKEMGQGEGTPHQAYLEEKGPKWLFLTTPGFLIEPLVDEPQRLTFHRSETEVAKLENYHGEKFDIAVFSVIKSEKKIYALDLFSEGLRIQLTYGLFHGDDHEKIDHILFTKEV